MSQGRCNPGQGRGEPRYHHTDGRSFMAVTGAENVAQRVSSVACSVPLLRGARGLAAAQGLMVLPCVEGEVFIHGIGGRGDGVP